MRRSALIITLLVCCSVAAAQAPRVSVAYAHLALDIRFGDAGPPTFEVSGSLYPMIEIPGALCPGTECPAGFSTPFGYVYSSAHFDRNPHYHTEEILHLRQWEALGPAYLAAYVLTQGEPFEPYDSRSPFPASAAKDGDWWRLDKMWVPPAMGRRRAQGGGHARVRGCRSGRSGSPWLVNYVCRRPARDQSSGFGRSPQGIASRPRHTTNSMKRPAILSPEGGVVTGSCPSPVPLRQTPSLGAASTRRLLIQASNARSSATA